ncbi:MAG: hypothetical protein K6U07_05645 [Firmicutes bacterium]|nr:hypothetical protein [Bacillota bacterium]
MFLYWLVVLLMLLGLYAGLVLAGLADLSLGLPPDHPVRRLARSLARTWRRRAPDEEMVEEMARRLRGGPGSWPAAGL